MPQDPANTMPRASARTRSDRGRFLPIITTALVACTASAGPGCNNPAYFDGFESLVVDDEVLMLEGHPIIGPFVQSEYWLDFGAPRPEELAALQPTDAEPAVMTPFIRRDDVSVSVVWTLHNTGDDPITAYILLDAATEFYDWNPIEMYGIGGGEDGQELPLPSLLGLTPRHLQPGARMHGEFREDDTVEAFYDLDVLTRFCGGPLAVIYNRSEANPAGTTMVPQDATIAGPVMIRMTLGATGPATLDYSLRIRDHREVLFDARVDEQRYETVPQPYVPAGLALVPAGSVDPGVVTQYCGSPSP